MCQYLKLSTKWDVNPNEFDFYSDETSKFQQNCIVLFNNINSPIDRLVESNIEVKFFKWLNIIHIKFYDLRATKYTWVYKSIIGDDRLIHVVKCKVCGKVECMDNFQVVSKSLITFPNMLINKRKVELTTKRCSNMQALFLKRFEHVKNEVIYASVARKNVLHSIQHKGIVMMINESSIDS